MLIPFVNLQAQYRLLHSEIREAFEAVCSSSSFIKGPILDEFEKEFAKFVGAKYCIGVASGTDALHLSLLALNIGKDDEVALPVNTFVATAFAVVFTGATPVFVDIDPLTLNIDINELKKKFTQKTKVIIPVHLYGQPANMDEIMKFARKHHLFVLEDAAQAHGAIYNNRVAGTFGHLAAFSFYPGKNLGAYGDGGAITTNSSKLNKVLRQLREYGSKTKYLHGRVGYNSRLDTIQAAILQIKLKHLSSWNQKRQKAADYYNKRINREIPFIKTPIIDKKARSVFHLYVIQTPKRNKLLNYLSQKGIQTGIHYPKPLHLQKALKNLGYKKGAFPIAEKVSSQILSLPIYPELTFKQQDYIVESIKSFFKL